MSLTSPLTLILAWVALPLLVAGLAWGLGHGIAMLAGVRLRALTAPVGFAGAMGVGASLLKLGVSGVLTVVVLALLSVAGPLTSAVMRARARTPVVPRLGAAVVAPLAAAAGAYAIGIAPLVASGRAGVLGYVLSNDSAVHLSIVALLADHGAELRPPVSSLESVSGLFEAGYPLGSYIWPLTGQLLTGVDAFYWWTPLIALSGAMTALAAYSMLRAADAPRPLAALAGAVVANGYVLFSLAAQGYLKEVMLATTVTTSVAALVAVLGGRLSVRALLPAALSATGALAVFGPGALAFLGPAAVVAAAIALLARRGRLRWRAALGLTGASLLSLAIAAPALLASTRFVSNSELDTRDPNELGNLVGPVPVRETANVWLAGDYRFPDPQAPLATGVGTLLAAGLAVAGLAWLLLRRRRTPGIPLLLLGAALASAYATWRYSPYFSFKTFGVLAAAIGLASAAGVVALRQRERLRRAALVLGAALALLVLVSDGYVLRAAWTTPKDRFQELMDINERYAGTAPALVVEREDFAKYLLRDLKPFESWGFWQPDRGLQPSVDPSYPFHTPDLDDYRLDFLARFKLLVERKRPGASRPPSGFVLREETEHYRVWARDGALPEQHFGLHRDEFDRTAPLGCQDPPVAKLLDTARTEDRPVRALVRDADVHAVPASRWHWFSGPPRLGPERAYRGVRGGATTAVVPARLAPGRYRVWLRGQFGPGLRIAIGDAEGYVGDVFGDLGQVDQWIEVGEARVRSASDPVFVSGLGLPFWRTGSAREDLVGAVAFEPVETASRVVEVDGAAAKDLCGRTVDWIELP